MRWLRRPDAQQLHAIFVLQPRAPGGIADQRGIGLHDRLDRADLLVRLFLRHRLVRPRLLPAATARTPWPGHRPRPSSTSTCPGASAVCGVDGFARAVAHPAPPPGSHAILIARSRSSIVARPLGSGIGHRRLGRIAFLARCCPPGSRVPAGWGSSRQPTLRKTNPSAVSDRPTGAKSNILNGLPSVSWRTWLTMMLVEVPTSVTSPPSNEMNDIGISIAETELPSLRPSLIAVGIRIVSAPTFFVMHRQHVRSPRSSRAPARAATVSRASSGRIAVSMTPDRAIAADTISARGDDDDDVAGEAGEGGFHGHDPDRHRRRPVRPARRRRSGTAPRRRSRWSARSARRTGSAVSSNGCAPDRWARGRLTPSAFVTAGRTGGFALAFCTANLEQSRASAIVARAAAAPAKRVYAPRAGARDAEKYRKTKQNRIARIAPVQSGPEPIRGMADEIDRPPSRRRTDEGRRPGSTPRSRSTCRPRPRSTAAAIMHRGQRVRHPGLRPREGERFSSGRAAGTTMPT